jgi:hypothetical protein
MDKSLQLKSKNFDYQPNPKLLAIQRMTEASEQKKNTNIQIKKNNFGFPDMLKVASKIFLVFPWMT